MRLIQKPFLEYPIMRSLNPFVLLLTIIGLAAGILVYLDSNSTLVVAENSGSLAAVVPHSGYGKPVNDLLSFNATVTETTPANFKAHSPDAVADESTRTLSIRVSGLKNQVSTLYVAVFDSAKGFPKPEHSRTTTTVPVNAESVEFSLSLPATSTTGIAVFQDLNGDGKLTKSRFGLPIEPYGFSNDARSTFGPPSFSQAAFQVSEKTPAMEISVH